MNYPLLSNISGLLINIYIYYFYFLIIETY